MQSTIAERLADVLERLGKQSLKIHADKEAVKLIAVSKTKPAEQVAEAYQAGQRRFGENYVQEGVEKIQALSHLAHMEWHFIGPLQSNKTRPVAEHFHWVQSVDRLKIAQRLNEQRPEHMPPLNVLLQFNVSQEQSKSGAEDEKALFALAEAVQTMPNLCLRGLMTIPSATDDQQALRQEFEAMQDLFLRLKSQYNQVDTLSMGMSGDWTMAIECGANMVRLGTAIFGERQTRAS
ncbi:YggS family pyridoxal phosphate-dependent enzyme [Aliiglaciecola sp. CAU 1673]|uniref:YggS family pyridoxal phosphate-dependent enzyme n=1 Tax=Aliiglaciecola sp. CAU 1673 TaxID=3032595 RepID=UPI0023D9D5CE|nr:YggS family pyridoxal phosphate-dependent enzyme [Aliiglaciecola sp. CAU 1673]MDF2179499.1 YggS family pyridoxal phosphate-dependent enzyme [Aliiglaciecola sp. CAU 1673]